ncbi:NAD/NADP transhydrogenase subunit beta [Aphanothece hegewaldii CCALA 016]|uniref:NAD/NADP transhydrogenase subunit beta n=1 Tax=Aphanothece hegewaldii CCALA 016 TaxID=2107694 RepID=A0A2T1LT16_9CHRO|nr:NAD/NADP transhydrogenase subunit beta [Aphanothece hegewaldii]PSF33442.1 NAD/NADP transhydrogenase subunit beta [Aphanothece hegewaldii CCALA 016]
MSTANQAQTILQNGLLSQQAVTTAMDSLWTQMLQSPLYDTIADLGVWFAVGTMGLFIVLWTKALLEDETSPVHWERWLWVIVVISLLTNQAALCKDCTLALRNLINTVNASVLQATLNQSNALIDAYNMAVTQTGVQGWYEQELLKCQSIADPQQKQQCSDDALKTANHLASLGAPNQSPNWWQKLGSGVGMALTSNIETVMIGFLLGFGVAVQWLVEVTWVLMGMAAPLSVGGTLLPVSQKSLFAWLIGFYAVGLYKLFFNILVGMVAIVQIGAQTPNSLIFAIATGLLSPILALTLAAGGGWATLTSLGTIAGAVAGGVGGKAIGIAAAGGRMGFRMAAHPAMRRAGQAYQNRVSPAWRKRIRARVEDATTPVFANTRR